jgi:protein kinase A
MSPEIVLTQGHDKSADYWAYGVLIFELLCGHTPFEGRNEQRTFEKIVHSQKHLNFPRSFDPHTKSLIRRLLHPNPALRLGALQNGFDDIRNHAYFEMQNVDFEKLLAQEVPMIYIPPAVDMDALLAQVPANRSKFVDLAAEVAAVVDDDFEEQFCNLDMIDISES